MKKLLSLIILVVISFGCTHNTTDKHQHKRDNLVNVKDKIEEIKMDDVLLGSNCRVYMIDDYLIVSDFVSPDDQIYLFNKDDFRYISSTAPIGQGPGEIARIGHIAIDETHRKFYVNDHGKQRVFSYSLDSVLTNPFYKPDIKMVMDEAEFPSRYQYINDTLSIGIIIKPIGHNNFNMFLSKFNMVSGDIHLMKDFHPEIKRKRFDVAISVDDNTLIECHNYIDLIVIRDLSGNLRYNIYGPHWDKKMTDKISYYSFAKICRDKIFVLYSGSDTFVKGKNEAIERSLPSAFMVFDLNGEYIKTLETGYEIADFCYDKENNRIIMNMDDEIQFGYLDLDGLVE